MADKYSKLYKRGVQKGYINPQKMSETQFREQTKTDEGLKSYYDYTVRKGEKYGAELNKWESFRSALRGDDLIEQAQQTAAQKKVEAEQVQQSNVQPQQVSVTPTQNQQEPTSQVAQSAQISQQPQQQVQENSQPKQPTDYKSNPATSGFFAMQQQQKQQEQSVQNTLQRPTQTLQQQKAIEQERTQQPTPIAKTETEEKIDYEEKRNSLASTITSRAADEYEKEMQTLQDEAKKLNLDYDNFTNAPINKRDTERAKQIKDEEKQLKDQHALALGAEEDKEINKTLEDVQLSAIYRATAKSPEFAEYDKLYRERQQKVIDKYWSNFLTEKGLGDVAIEQAQLEADTKAFQNEFEQKQKAIEDKYIQRINNATTLKEIESIEKQYVAEYNAYVNSVKPLYYNLINRSNAYNEKIKPLIDKGLQEQLQSEFEQKYGETINLELSPDSKKYQELLNSIMGDYIAYETKRVGMDDAINSLQQQRQRFDDYYQQKIKGFNYNKQTRKYDRTYYRDANGLAGKGEIAVYINKTMRADEAPMAGTIKKYLDMSEEMQDAVINQRGFWKAFGQTISSADTWSFGLTELSRNQALLRVIKKQERGEELSRDEEFLLDAAANFAATTAYFSEDLPSAYKSGQTTAASVPFMLEFMLGAGAMSAVERSIVGGLLRWSLRKAGGLAARGTALRTLIHAGGTLVGKAAATTINTIGMTALFGGGQIAAGTTQRQIGTILPDLKVDANGNPTFVYGGRTDQQSLAEAFKNASIDQLVENFSEMCFGILHNPALKGLIGKGGQAVVKWLGLAKQAGRLTEFLSNMSKLPIFRYAQQAQWHGIVGEFAEEVIGGLLRWGMASDVNSAKEAGLTRDDLIDTFLGLAPTSVFFGLIGTAQYANGQRTISRYGRQVLEQLRQQDNTEFFRPMMHEAINNCLDDETLSEKEKIDFLHECSVIIAERANERRQASFAQAALARREALSTADADLQENIGRYYNDRAFNDGFIYEVTLANDPQQRGFIVHSDANDMLFYDEESNSLLGENVVTVKMQDGSVKQVSLNKLNFAGRYNAQEAAENTFNEYQGFNTVSNQYRVGDQVEIDGKTATINEIDMNRGVTYTTQDGLEVRLTNASAADKINPLIPQQSAIIEYKDSRGAIHQFRDNGDGTLTGVGTEDGNVRWLGNNLSEYARLNGWQPLNQQTPAAQTQTNEQQAPETQQQNQEPKIGEKVEFTDGVVTIKGTYLGEGKYNIGNSVRSFDDLYKRGWRTNNFKEEEKQSEQPTNEQANQEQQNPDNQEQQTPTSVGGNIVKFTDGNEIVDYVDNGDGTYSVEGLEGASKLTEDELHDVGWNIWQDNNDISPEREKDSTQKKIQDWEEKLGVKINVIYSEEAVPETQTQAIEAIQAGKEVEAWYDEATGGIYLYMPNVLKETEEATLSRIDELVFHEVVAHKGIQQFIGKENYEKLCLKVFDEMTDEQKESWLKYAKTGHEGYSEQRLRIIAGDEYIAHLAEKVSHDKATTEELNTWEKICNNIFDLLNKLFNTDFNLKQKDLANLIRASYENMRRQAANQEQENEQENNEENEEEDENVPDWLDDNYDEARKRGWIKVNGEKVYRQEPLQNVIKGNNTTIRFDSKNAAVNGTYVIAEADDIQQSHKNGQRNPLHFIPEAQPKNRTDKASDIASTRMAQNMDTTQAFNDNGTAYTGCPVVNTRGEVIQGNGRKEGIDKMYDSNTEQTNQSKERYKQDLIKKAQELGVSEEEIEKIKSMQKPMLVRMVDVSNEQAIRLGQKTIADMESGGNQRISPTNIIRQLSDSQRAKIIEIILEDKSGNEKSISDLIEDNGKAAIEYLQTVKIKNDDGTYTTGVLNETQVVSAFDRFGNLTPEVREDLLNIVLETFFYGSKNSNIKEFYLRLKAGQRRKLNKIFLTIIARDYKIGEKHNRLLPDLQEALEVYYYAQAQGAFDNRKGEQEVKNGMAEWANSYRLSEDWQTQYMPQDRYSALARDFAARFEYMTQKELVALFNKYYDFVVGAGGDVFNPAQKLNRYEAIREVFGVETNGETPLDTAKRLKRNIEEETKPVVEGTSGGDGQEIMSSPSVNSTLQSKNNQSNALPKVDTATEEELYYYVSKLNSYGYSFTEYDDDVDVVKFAKWLVKKKPAAALKWVKQGNIVTNSFARKIYNACVKIVYGKQNQRATTASAGNEPATTQTESAVPSAQGGDEQKQVAEHKPAQNLEQEEEQPPVQKPKQEPVAKQENAENVAQHAKKAWDLFQYENGQISDVIEYVNDNIPKSETTQALYDAIDKYEQEDEDDRNLWGRRGDLEPYRDAILDELERLSKQEEEQQAREAELSDAGVRYSISKQILDAFNDAKDGNLTGKPIKIGTLTADGKKFLEELSGLKMKDNIDFRLNPSDLVHIYNDHYGNNEKDKGNNIPLTDNDIQRMVDVIAYPTDVVYGEDKQGRKLFYFLRQEPNGAYNLLEIYADRKGNLTTKTYYKTKKGVSQRVMEIQSLLPTSKTYSGSTLSNAKIPKLFDIPKEESEKNNIRLSYNPAKDPTLTPQAVAEMQEIKDKAIANGTYLKAPNGKKSNLDERAWLQVRTRAFKRWFGDWENNPEDASKILDENGEPLVVKHGTPYNFTIFDEEKQGEHDAGWLGKGFYFFGKNDIYAGQYANGGNVLSCFLNIRNPYYATYQDMKRLAELNDRETSEQFTQDLIDEGYDGVYYDGDLNGECVAFSPNQIKSATDNNGDFSEENDDIRFSFSNQNNDIFYSNAERAVEGIKQDKATPQQWLAMIDKAGGLKAGEDKWLGLSDWLKSFEIGENETPSEAIARNNKRTITKQEILDFIRQNKIHIEEVNYSKLPDIADTEIGKEFYALRNQYAEEDNYQSLVAEYALRAFVELEDKYGDDFSLAFYLGDSDHRLYVNDQEAANYFIGFSDHAINDTRLVYTTNGLTNKREIALVVPTIESWNENDEIHFGDAGEGRAIAWVRFGDTTDEQGNKVLVIDEIQSKRHQEGREKGYREGELPDTEKQEKELREQLKAIRQRINEIIPADINGIHARYEFSKNLPEGLKEELTTLREDESRLVIEISNLKSARTDYQRQIPAAPFEKNWHELAFKRMLRFAAENGYDKVAWTTGEQQAERYNLGTVVKSITLTIWAEPDSSFNVEHRTVLIDTYGHPIVFTIDRQGNVLDRNRFLEHQPNTLADVVGKELANRLLTTDEREIKGDNLRIGGEGMKGFYDDMLPRFVSKYAKKWGAKVGEVTMPELQDGYQTMHSVDITEPMKESVMQGQALFSIIGEIGAAKLDAAEEVTTRMDNLNIARRMEAEGKDARAIRLATGWERGADQKWRYEIDDVDFNQDAFIVPTHNTKLDEVLINADELFAAYPELKGYFITWQSPYFGENGVFDKKTKTITLNRRFYDGGANWSRRYDKSVQVFSGRNVLLHELQHAIQHIEGFARGGNKMEFDNRLDKIVYDADDWIKRLRKFKSGRAYLDALGHGTQRDIYIAKTNLSKTQTGKEFDKWSSEISYIEYPNNYIVNQSIFEDRVKDKPLSSFQKYRALAGETESRNVEDRLNLTPEQRRERLLRETEDVAREDQIILFDLLDKVLAAGEVKFSTIKRIIKQIGIVSNPTLDSQEYAKISHAIDTMIPNTEKGEQIGVWLDKFYYLCTSNGDSKGFTINTQIPIDGNEDLTSIIHNYSKDEVIKNPRNLFDALKEFRLQQRSHFSDNANSNGRRGMDVESNRRIGTEQNSRTGTIPQSNRDIRKSEQRGIDELGDIFAIAGQPEFREIDDDETLSEYASRYHEWLQQQKDIALFEHYWHDYARRNVNEGKKRLDDQIEEDWFNAELSIERFQDFLKDIGGKVTTNVAHFVWQARGKQTYQQNQVKRNLIYPLMSTVKDLEKLIGTKGGKDTKLHLRWQNLDESKVGRRYKRNGTPVTARELIGLYLQAKDIDECEKLGLPSRGAEGFYNNLGISHTDLIKAFENNINYISDLIDNLWDCVNAISNWVLDYQKENGLIDQDAYDKYYGQREFYVPQRGWRGRDLANLEDEYIDTYGGVYNSPYNSALIKADGRESLAGDPIAYLWSIANSAIYTAQKNAIREHALQLMLDNEELGVKSGIFRIRKIWIMNEMDNNGRIKRDDDGNAITRIEYKEPSQEQYQHDKDIRKKIKALRKQLRDYKLLNKGNLTDPNVQQKIYNFQTKIQDLENQLYIAGGINATMAQQLTSKEKGQHSVIVLKDGQRYWIEIDDANLANSINQNYRVDDAKESKLENLISSGTRYYSSTKTQYSPKFAAGNLLKDRQAAVITLSAEKGKLFTSKFILNERIVQPAVLRYVFGDKVSDEEKYINSKYGKYLEEYFKAGSQTGYSFLSDIENLQKQLTDIKDKKMMQKALEKMVDLCSVITEWSELSTRFAAYVTAREDGMSIEDSAALSKELTTNFDRRGKAMYRRKGFGAYARMFSFINATLQGNYKYYRGFKRFTKKYSLWVAVYALAGFLDALLNPDDPDNSVSDYIQQTHIIIGKVKIPVTHFFVIPYAIGVNMAKYIKGQKTGGKAIYDSIDMLVSEQLPGAFNIFNILNLLDYDEGNAIAGGSGIVLNPKKYAQRAMPSIVSPVTDLIWNQDFKGSEIMPTPYEHKDWKNQDAEIKDVLKRKSNTSEDYVKLAERLYKLSGGDLTTEKENQDPLWRQVMFDHSPSGIEHLVNSYSPQVLESVEKTANWIVNGVDDPKNKPFIGKFYAPMSREANFRSKSARLTNFYKRYEAILDDNKRNHKQKYLDMMQKPLYAVYKYTKAYKDFLKDNPDLYSNPSVENVQEIDFLVKSWINNGKEINNFKTANIDIDKIWGDIDRDITKATNEEYEEE